MAAPPPARSPTVVHSCQALFYCARAVALEPTYIRARMVLAVIHLHNDNGREALLAVTQGLHMAPSNNVLLALQVEAPRVTILPPPAVRSSPHERPPRAGGVLPAAAPRVRSCGALLEPRAVVGDGGARPSARRATAAAPRRVLPRARPSGGRRAADDPSHGADAPAARPLALAAWRGAALQLSAPRGGGASAASPLARGCRRLLTRLG